MHACIVHPRKINRGSLTVRNRFQHMYSATHHQPLLKCAMGMVVLLWLLVWTTEAGKSGAKGWVGEKDMATRKMDGSGAEQQQKQQKDAKYKRSTVIDSGSRRSFLSRAMQEEDDEPSYISYRALLADITPCPPMSGLSYYTNDCYSATPAANPYTRDCSTITRCAHDTS